MDAKSEAIKDAAQIIARVALDLIDKDGHVFGSRPCSTCRTITNLINKEFGCVRYASARKNKAPEVES